MSMLDRIRSWFSSAPKMGRPSTGRLMERGEGEVAGRRDETRDTARGHNFGAPNDTLEDSVRPPLS